MDRAILKLVLNGNISPYSIWSQMKLEAEDRDIYLAYVNVNKRVRKLAKAGYLEEIKPDKYTVNIHGRRDFKLTIKGLEQLIPDILAHSQEIQKAIEYMDKFGLDKNELGKSLLNEIENMVSKTEDLAGGVIMINQYHFLPEMMMQLDRLISLREKIKKQFPDSKQTTRKRSPEQMKRKTL